MRAQRMRLVASKIAAKTPIVCTVPEMLSRRAANPQQTPQLDAIGTRPLENLARRELRLCLPALVPARPLHVAAAPRRAGASLIRHWHRREVVAKPCPNTAPAQSNRRRSLMMLGIFGLRLSHSQSRRVRPLPNRRLPHPYQVLPG